MVWCSIARRAYELYDLCISSLIKVAADCWEKSWHVDIFTYSDVSPQQLTVNFSSEFLFRRKYFNDASSIKTVFLKKKKNNNNKKKKTTESVCGRLLPVGVKEKIPLFVFRYRIFFVTNFMNQILLRT